MHSRYGITLDGLLVAHATVSLDTFELSSLYVEPAFRRLGYGRRIMKMVCDQADQEGVALDLMPAGDCRAMSTEQLEAWYARFGFKRAPNCMMVRHPRVKAKGSPT